MLKFVPFQLEAHIDFFQLGFYAVGCVPGKLLKIFDKVHLVIIAQAVNNICPCGVLIGADLVKSFKKPGQTGIHFGRHPQSFFAFAFKLTWTQTGNGCGLVYGSIVMGH